MASTTIINNNKGFYNKTPGASTGKCIEQNGTRFLELVAKYGDSKFSLVTQRTKQYYSEGQAKANKEWLETYGEQKQNSKNYRFHLLILNETKDQYIDVASGRAVIMDREEYQALLRVTQERHFEYKKVDGPQIMDMIRSNRSNNPKATDLDLLKHVVMIMWRQLGW